MTVESRLEACALVRAVGHRDYETAQLIYGGSDDRDALTTSLALLCSSILRWEHGDDFDDVLDLLTEHQLDEAPA